MTKRGITTALAGTAVLGLALTACSSDDPSSASSSSPSPSSSASAGASTAHLTACPATKAGAPPAGAPAGGAPAVPVAKTIAKSDTSTSTVVTPDGPQIQCGRTAVETHSDIVYSTPTSAGKKVELKLDVQAPKTGGKKPLVVYIPGGGFVQAVKEGSLDQKTYVAEQGYVVASVQYRTTVNGATYKDGVADVKSAIRYLRAHADAYGIDTGRTAVWGESAGGYLAAMVGTTNGVKEFDRGDNLDQSSEVQAVVDKFGAADLSRIGADYDTAAREANTAPGNALAQYVYGPGTKKSVGQYTAEVEAADPTTYIDAKDPAFVLFHGSADHLISPSESLAFHTALRAKGVTSTRYVIEGADHGDMTFMGNAKAGIPWSTQKVMNEITSFLDARLGG